MTIAEQRMENAERERRELIMATDCKLQDASRALKQAQSRIAAVEDQFTAAEFRAQAAEAEAREARQASRGRGGHPQAACVQPRKRSTA